MTTTTSTSAVSFDPAGGPYPESGLIPNSAYAGLTVTVTGPVAGVWTITAPDVVTLVDLNASIAGQIAYATAVASTVDLLAKAAAAQTANATFMALATPTNAQVLAQVKSLTKQSNALIKLASSDLSNTTGT